MNAPKTPDAAEKKPETGTRSPHMTRGIYHNYEKGMKAGNRKRRERGLTALHVRSFEEWSRA